MPLLAGCQRLAEALPDVQPEVVQLCVCDRLLFSSRLRFCNTSTRSSSALTRGTMTLLAEARRRLRPRGEQRSRRRRGPATRGSPWAWEGVIEGASRSADEGVRLRSSFVRVCQCRWSCATYSRSEARPGAPAARRAPGPVVFPSCSTQNSTRGHTSSSAGASVERVIERDELGARPRRARSWCRQVAVEEVDERARAAPASRSRSPDRTAAMEYRLTYPLSVLRTARSGVGPPGAGA